MTGVSPWDVRGNLIRYYRITVQFLRVCRHDNLFFVCQVSSKNRRFVVKHKSLRAPFCFSSHFITEYFTSVIFFKPFVTERDKQIKFTSKAGSV